MEIEKLCSQVLVSFLVEEECDLCIKKKAQEKVVDIARNMGIMKLGYYDVTRNNKWFFPEIVSQIDLRIKDYLDNLNIFSVQKCCIDIANMLSTCSFAIFEPDIISTDSKDLVGLINFLSQITGEKPDGIEVQEKIGMLKEALDLIYFDIQGEIKNKDVQKNKVTEEEFMDLLELEVAVIMIFELDKSLRLDKDCIIHLEDAPVRIYSEQLEMVDRVLQKMLTVKEPLYDAPANKVMLLFKKEKGFDEESLLRLCNDFGSKETISMSLNDMETLIKERLCLNDTQLDFFVSIMFLNSKFKERTEIIRNVNYSFFTTPFIPDINGMVWLNKSNLCEAAKYLRRRIINGDIHLSKNIRNMIKEKINEKSLPIIKEELQAKGIECFTNVDLAKDEELKELFYDAKNTPHELDLYYVDNNVLKIYDLKNYLIPLSVKESVIRIENSISKEATKLHNLNKILETNHKLIEKRLNIHFTSIKYGILLTTDCYYSDKKKDVSVSSIDDFLRMIRNKGIEDSTD